MQLKVLLVSVKNQTGTNRVDAKPKGAQITFSVALPYGLEIVWFKDKEITISTTIKALVGITKFARNRMLVFTASGGPQIKMNGKNIWDMLYYRMWSILLYYALVI